MFSRDVSFWEKGMNFWITFDSFQQNIKHAFFLEWLALAKKIRFLPEKVRIKLIPNLFI